MFDNTSNENLSNKGIQVDLSQYLEYKKQFNDTRTISYSSSDLYHKRKKEQEEARSDFFIYGGTAAVSTKMLYEKAKKDEGIRALISEVPGAKLLKQKLTKQYLDNQAAQIISGAIDPRSTAVAPLSQSLQSILVSLEELSPSQILKTLQLSSFNSLFVEVIDEERKKARHIKQTSIQVYENYYKNLIFKESKIKLSDEDIKHGFILQNNKLYQAAPVAGNKGEVKAGRVLLDYATVVNSTVKTGDNHHSVNRVFEKFSNIYDANLNRSQLHTEPFVIVGGASKKSTVSTWARAYGRFSLEIGAKSLDNPLGFLEEYLDMTGLNNSKLVKNKYFQTAKGFTNFKLGTGGVYNISSAEMMKKIGKNLAIKGAAGVVGLNIIDATLDALTPDSSVWSSGLVAGMADTFMKAHVKFAELWSDNFQDLKKSQENSAPESTKLSTLIGVPLAGAMTGANLAFFKRMRDTATKGLEQSATIHTAEQKLGGLLGKAADKVGINIVGNTLSRYSKVGALLGATLTLPFLPGALVGKSSEELRQEYSGEKEVAVRKDRGWLAGGTEYEGGQIKYFRQNLLRTIASDAKTKTLYGDRETKRRLDPVFNPIKYLRNPYRFEEMHQEDMPFPVWGMDVSYGSVLGQLYKGTIGELIKPTVIHPEVLKLQSEANPNLVLGVKGEIVKGILETISGKNSKSLSKLSAGNSEENSDTSVAIVDSDAYTTPENERKEVKSLIADGLMLRANAPTVSVLDRTLAGTSASLSDFTGLKGFSSSLLLGAANLDPTEQLRPELEVSGSSTNFSGTLSDANLGDMLGFGEFSRRLIPQSAAVKRDTVNPMRNQVAPDWLPKNETKYYKNFERGNYYCLAPNSLLETNTLEVKKACEIKVGDKLLGKFGKDTVVKNIETIPSQEVLKITINGSNNIPTYLTGEHPVAIRFKTYGESKSSEKTKIYRILKLLKNTSKGVSYPKNYFYKDLEVSIPTFSSLFKQMEQEGYIINNKKNIIRTYKDLPDEYLFENNIYFKEAKDLKVGDYVDYPKYREKLDIIEEFDLATIPGWSAISENYVYYTRTPESVIEFEWLRGESDIKPKSHINMSITKENSRDTRKARFDRYLKLDKNFGLFCGLWLAEGFKNGTAHHVSEHEFVNNIYNNSPLETYKWCPVSNTNGAQMRYSCKALDMFLEYTFGSGAKFKHLNNYLLHTPEEFIKGLIEGYYFGDGTTYNNKGRYSETATSASDKLLIQLKLLMIRRLGVVSILNDYKYNPKPVVINGVINGIDSGYKQNLVIRRQDSNSNLWTQDENFYYFRINKIEKEPCNVVYAFETSDNTFCTYSMLTHNSNMENGEYLLPGSKGFETLNPELKGIDPNNYPLVYQYKILQNVARGSSEHIAVKKYLAEHLDELSEKEKDVFFEAYGQDTERDVQKRFTDYKTGAEKSNMGVIGLTQNAIWESFSHLESPLEPLIPFRPMAKFVHQRTAVEDYIKTQLMGSDVGIWTNPYSHFLKPTLNRLADSGSIDQFKPKEAIEKENIDTYFDKLSLVKAIKTNDTYDIERNITALSYLGINDPGSMKRFKSALPEGQSAYVEAFSQEKDKKKRNQILSLVPKDIGRAYQSIWSNIDIYDQAILKGKDPNKALEEEYLKDSKKLKSAFSIDITRQDRETIHNQASTLANDEDKKRFEQYQEAKLIRLKAAQKEATEYVENQTGSLPSDNWIGWDPRLTIDDIKLKTLTIGREDIHRFGYWQKDLERSERLIGLKEGEIVNELENIKAEKRSNVAREFAIRSRLRNIGFEVSTINSVPSNSNQLKITDKQEYLRAYNNSV